MRYTVHCQLNSESREICSSRRNKIRSTLIVYVDSHSELEKTSEISCDVGDWVTESEVEVASQTSVALINQESNSYFVESYRIMKMNCKQNE